MAETIADIKINNLVMSTFYSSTHTYIYYIYVTHIYYIFHICNYVVICDYFDRLLKFAKAGFLFLYTNYYFHALSRELGGMCGDLRCFKLLEWFLWKT